MTRKGIYPGSFDPITNGHIDIINRAKLIFDEIHIAIFNNPDKNQFFTYEERVSLIKTQFKDDPQIVVGYFKGLMVNYAEENNIFTIIRGLRAVSDFDYEFQMSLTNRKMNKKIDTICLMTDINYSYLSSSLVRQLAQFKGDISQFVPSFVEESIRRKMINE